METNRRLMLMIDGDNAQAALLPQMLAEVSKYGVMKIRRVYGDWGSPQLKPWKDLLHTYALKPEQQFSYTSGKNATDIALIIDAMDFINTAGVDGICIVSSDSDYTPLATRIREKNLFVMGIGRSTTPRAFVNACDVFVYTENLRSNVEDVSSGASLPASKLEDEPVPVNDGSHIEGHFRSAFDAAVQDDGWAHLGTFGSSLRQLDPGFDPRTYGHKLLSQLVQADPNFFETQKRASKGGNEVIYIRLKV
jgi:NYN domain/OST-HTH/LOTUS domain